MNDIGKISRLSPLSRDNDHVRTAPAPNFWALMPHQLHQHTDSACSLASAVMVLNGARGVMGQNRISGLVSEKRLLEKFRHTDWPAGIAPDGGGRKLARLAEHLEEALGFYDLAGWTVECVPVAAADAASGETLRTHLATMEKQIGYFPIANFHLDLFYGDGSDIGHFSPLAAYDAARDLVLVLDVYKADYEPSWAPVDHLHRAMAKPCDDGQLRGYLVVKQG
jgi:hypothetical protein